MTAADSFLPLPTASFLDQGEFREWRRRNGALVAARAQRDATQAGGRREGSCGVCLRPAAFVGPRDRLACDCESGLAGPDRALLHFALGNIGVQPWFRVLVLAPDLRDGLAALARVGCAPAGGHHLAVANAVPGSFNDIARSLVPGGRFAFTCPFEPERSQSWHILDGLREVGFHGATAHLYWSEEFGYLGPANFIFVGIR